MNRMLARQLRRAHLTADEPPATQEQWQAFLDHVAAAYEEADRGRYLLERSMAISSRELQEAAASLAALSRQQVQRTEQHYHHVFSILPVAAWEEDFSSVAARLRELRDGGVSDLDRYFDEHPDRLVECVAMVSVVDCNAAVGDLLGVVDRSSLVGPIDTSHLSPTSLESWRRQFAAIWHGEGRVELEFVGERPDGSPFAGKLHWNAAPVDGTYDYSRVIVVVVDLSDRVASEDRMRRLVQAKDEFLASVSHELRTPLTSVMGYADILRSADVQSAEQRDMITTIAEQASDLSEIVEDLLIGARADLGQLEAASRQVDVAELVGHVAGSLDCPGQLIGADAPVLAIGDAGRVRQILRNLLSNAQRYGGRRHRIEIVGSEGLVTIAVCDDGEPLAPEVAERIFERYYRAEHDANNPGSVGIGLTISRDLAELMGGTLTYRHDGTWARFELSLPAVAQPAMRVAS